MLLRPAGFSEVGPGEPRASLTCRARGAFCKWLAPQSPSLPRTLAGVTRSRRTQCAARLAPERMCQTLNPLLLTGLLGLTGSALASESVSPNALEPAINGAVSDDGLYPSQSMKRQALGS